MKSSFSPPILRRFMSVKPENIVRIRVELPKSAIEETHSSYGISRGIRSHHTNDLKVIFAVVFLSVFGILCVQFYVDGFLFNNGNLFDLEKFREEGNAYSRFFLAASVSVTAGLILTLFQIGKKRFASVDLFSMEMLSIVRMVAISDIIPLAKVFLDSVRSGDEELRQAALLKLAAGLAIFGEDNFAEVFVKNTGELGWLDAEIVDYTTGFYTFVRSLHNLTNSFKIYLEENKGQEETIVVKKYIEDIHYVIDTAMDNAYRSFEGFIQNKAHRKSAQQSALYVGTRSNNLLLFDLLKETDGKFTTASRRNLSYQRAVHKLGN